MKAVIKITIEQGRARIRVIPLAKAKSLQKQAKERRDD